METLIQQAQSGNQDALRKLIAEFYVQIYRFCARRVGPDHAEDLAQETCITMVKSVKKYDGSANLKTWVLGIAHNHCRNWSRKNKQAGQQLEVWMDQSSKSHESAVVDSVTLSNALKKLSDEHKEVVVLHELDGLTYAEIAELLSIPEGTVKSRLHHAFSQLRNTICGGQS